MQGNLTLDGAPRQGTGLTRPYLVVAEGFSRSVGGGSRRWGCASRVRTRERRRGARSPGRSSDNRPSCTLARRPRQPFKRLCVRDVHVAVSDLHPARLPERPERPGDGLPLGPDHARQKSVSEPDGYLAAAVAHDDALVLAELEYEARQPRGDVFVHEVGEPILAHPETRAQETGHRHPHLRVAAHELLEILPPERPHHRGFERLHARRPPKGEARLPEEGPPLYYREREPSSGVVRLEDPRPPAHEHEEDPPVLGHVEGLARLQASDGGAHDELFRRGQRQRP